MLFIALYGSPIILQWQNFQSVILSYIRYQAEGGGRKGAGRRGRGGAWSRKGAAVKPQSNDVRSADNSRTGGGGVVNSKSQAELLANQFLATPTGKVVDGPSTSGQ